jgi:predicted RNA-binding Zn-ribbon protein involved in translation (DUF1610 family)
MYVIIRKGQQAQENEVVRRMRDNQYSRYEEMANGLVVTNAEQMLREYGERPICPKCEREMFRSWKKGDPDHKQGYCPHCGYRGGSITIAEYLHAKLYR